MNNHSNSENNDPSIDRQREMIDAAFEQVEELREGRTKTVSALAAPPTEGSDSGSVEPPPDSFTGYTIICEIHRGGQGVVYKAFQKATKRKVAIKVMKDGPFAGSADEARFEREIQILDQLSHPSIVTIHDTGLSAGCHHFVIDYISGNSSAECNASPCQNVKMGNLALCGMRWYVIAHAAKDGKRTEGDH